MRRWLAIAGAILGLALIGYALFAEENDEERIRARLTQLEDAVGVDGEASNPIMRTAHVNGEFKEIFEKEVTYKLAELTSQSRGRRALSGLATKAGMYTQTFDLSFTGVDVQITGGGTGAEVSTVAVLRVTRRNGRLERDEWAWTERATISFPTPLSPWISTVTSVSEICSMRA